MKKVFQLIALLPIALSAHALPTTSEEIDDYLQLAEQGILQKVEQISSSTDENKIRVWNRAGSDLLAHFGLFAGLSAIDAPIKNAAELGILELRDFLYETISKYPQVVHALVNYTSDQILNKAPNAYERYQIGFMLNSLCEISRFLPDDMQDNIYELKGINDGFEQTPYLYLKGEALEKKEGGLSVLTLNTCCVPGVLSLMHGGVSPWEERIEALGEKICSVNADVVCLQEISSEDTNFALYEALKSHYAHFYISIAPRPLGFSLDNLGLPSGLFVASKYPIDKPAFTLYDKAGYPMNWGCFDFIVRGDDRPLGHIYTTHLQSLDEKGFAEIRAQQLQQLVDKMQTDLYAERERMPYFLCGDLNIPFGSGEIGEQMIRKNFYDDYNRDELPASEQNWTCTGFFTNGNPNFQILDYALLLDDSACEGFEIDTVQVPMSSLSDPQNALSDHHGLLTYVIAP